MFTDVDSAHCWTTVQGPQPHNHLLLLSPHLLPRARASPFWCSTNTNVCMYLAYHNINTFIVRTWFCSSWLSTTTFPIWNYHQHLPPLPGKPKLLVTCDSVTRLRLRDCNIHSLNEYCNIRSLNEYCNIHSSTNEYCNIHSLNEYCNIHFTIFIHWMNIAISVHRVLNIAIFIQCMNIAYNIHSVTRIILLCFYWFTSIDLDCYASQINFELKGKFIF